MIAINKKTIAFSVIGLLLLAVLSEVLVRSTGSSKSDVTDTDKEETAIRPETVIFAIEYKAKLEETGIWHVNHVGEVTNYIDVKQSGQVPPGGLVAVAECFNNLVIEEQINNELINLSTESSAGSQFINVKELLEKKYSLRLQKAACEIRNNTGVEVDFIPSLSGGEIKEGDLIGFFVDRQKFKQSFIINGNAASPIDSLALVPGANIVITADAVTTEGKIWNVDQSGDSLNVLIEPDETFRKDKIYLDKETLVRISRPIEMPLDEFNNVKKTTEAELTIMRRN